MISPTHETLASLFRNRPALGFELLRQNTGAELPRRVTARETAADFTDLQLPEYRADVVVRLDRADGEPACVIIVEIQLNRDDNKRFSWPHYEASARARLRCPATVLVIAMDRSIARWCAEPIVLGPGGSTSRPVVLGPDDIPRLDEDQAHADIELAVLSAAVHGHEPDSAEQVAATLLACERLDNERATVYADLIYAHLGEATLRALEALMELRRHQYQSEFARRYFAEGREEGHEEGLRTALCRLLKQRFGKLSTAIQQRIAQAERSKLEQWLDRVIPAQSTKDIFEDG